MFSIKKLYSITLILNHSYYQALSGTGPHPQPSGISRQRVCTSAPVLRPVLIHNHLLAGSLHPSRLGMRGSPAGKYKYTNISPPHGIEVRFKPCPGKRVLQRIQVFIRIHLLPVLTNLRPVEIRFPSGFMKSYTSCPFRRRKDTIDCWYSFCQLLAT